MGVSLFFEVDLDKHFDFQNITRLGNQGGVWRGFTPFFRHLLVYYQFLSPQISSRNYKNISRELRSHFIRSEILVHIT